MVLHDVNRATYVHIKALGRIVPPPYYSITQRMITLDVNLLSMEAVNLSRRLTLVTSMFALGEPGVGGM